MEQAIRLREHESRTVRLSPEEVRAIRNDLGGRVDLRLTEEPGEYELLAGSHVGVARLPSGRVLIVEPKVTIETLFALLAAIYDLDREVFRKDLHGYSTVEALFEFVVKMFAARVEEIVARGLLRGYRRTEEDLATVRGRVLIHDTLCRRPGLHDRHWCTYHQLSADVPENRVLFWTLFCLQHLPYKDPSLASRLRRCARTMWGVALDPRAPELLQRIAFNRLNARYERALGLARLLLDHLTITGALGETPFFCYLVDMNWLFERYVVAVVRREMELCGLEVKRQESHHLDHEGVVSIRPDAVLYQGERRCLAIDAKYKLDPSQADLYQMVAYCHALGIQRAVLVYPASEQPPKGRVLVRGPGDLEVIYLGLSLEGGPDQLEKAGKALAHRIVESIPLFCDTVTSATFGGREPLTLPPPRPAPGGRASAPPR